MIKDLIKISLISVIPSLVSLIVVAQFGQRFFVEYGLSALVANAPLMLFIKNEFRHYYLELKTNDWQEYFKLLYKDVIIYSASYAFIVNSIFYFIFDGYLDLFSIHIFNILAISNILMGLVSLAQARLFSLGKYEKFFVVSMLVSLLRVVFMSLAGIYLANPYFIVYAELIATLLVLFYVLTDQKLPFLSLNVKKNLSIKKSSGITDGLAITIYNIYSYTLFYYASMMITANYFLLFFATYRITRPMINLGSLFPNYILKNQIEGKKKYFTMFVFFTLVAVILILIEYSMLLPFIINFLAEDITYDSNIYYILILIGLISWINGLLAGNYMKIFKTSSGLLKAMITASLFSFILFVYTKNLIMTIAIFEILNLILISFITQIEKTS